MESSFDPRNVIQFTLENDKVVSARIQEGWSKHVPIEGFGASALLSLSEERARSRQFAQEPITKLAELPKSVSEEINERADKLMNRIFDFIDGVRKTANNEPADSIEIDEFADSHRRVVVKTSLGSLVEIEVNQQLLRARPEEAEHALVEAINKAEDSRGKSLNQTLAEMNAEFQEIRAMYRDYEKDTR